MSGLVRRETPRPRRRPRSKVAGGVSWKRPATARLAAVLAALPLAASPSAARVQKVAAVRDGHDANICLSAVKVVYRPGEGSKPHRHDATIIAYVVSGAIVSKVGSGSMRTYRAGQHFVETPGVEHAVSRNASSTASAAFLAITLAHKGSDGARACGI